MRGSRLRGNDGRLFRRCGRSPQCPLLDVLRTSLMPTMASATMTTIVAPTMRLGMAISCAGASPAGRLLIHSSVRAQVAQALGLAWRLLLPFTCSGACAVGAGADVGADVGASLGGARGVGVGVAGSGVGVGVGVGSGTTPDWHGFAVSAGPASSPNSSSTSTRHGVPRYGYVNDSVACHSPSRWNVTGRSR